MTRLSLCMIVRNAEAGLERCLLSALPFVDEIVIVDTGSQDRTIEIARKYAHILHQMPWPDDFSAARNVSLDLATGDWVLVLDGDEALHPPTAALLRPALEESQLIAYQLVHRHLLSLPADNPSAYRDVYALRLFRRHPELRFEWPIHEQISVAARTVALRDGLSVGRLPVVILHYGHLPGVNPHRNARNIRLMERYLADHPDDAYYLYKLSEELKDHQPARAETLLHRSCSLLLQKSPEQLRQHTFAQEVLAQSIQQLCHSQGAVATLPMSNLALERFPDSPLLYYLRAVLHLQCAKADPAHSRNAQQDLERCVALKSGTEDIYFDEAEVMGLAHQHLGDLYYQQGFYLRALNTYREALRLNPALDVAQVGALRAQALTGDPGGALRACLDWYKRSLSGDSALLVGELLMGLGQMGPAERWIASVERDFRNNPAVIERLPKLRQMLQEFSTSVPRS